MLKKLMKYDLMWTYKVLLIFYCLAFIFSFIAFGLSKTENSMLFSVLAAITNAFALTIAISALINCIMRAWVRFIQNFYKDEAYLTHTLPVSKNTIYASKICSSILCTFTTAAVSAFCIMLYLYNNPAISEKFKTILKTMAAQFNITVPCFILIIFAVFALETVFILFAGYVGIIIGHAFNKGKMIKSIIFGFVIYMAANVLSVGIIFITGLFDNNITYIITANEIVNDDTLIVLMLLFTAVYFAYDVILYFIGRGLLKKGVNVD